MEPIKNTIKEDITQPSNEEQKILDETRILRDTLDLLWNKTLEQRKVCEELQQENDYLQDYINSLMTSSNVLEK